jgi:hypothetical protein
MTNYLKGTLDRHCEQARSADEAIQGSISRVVEVRLWIASSLRSSQ